MSDLTREKARAALQWLVECGADEATGEAPINRLIGTTPVQIRGPRTTPVIRETQLTRTLNQSPMIGETPPTSSDVIAAACQSLEQLRAALSAFEGCELKRHATNLVFADGDPSGGVMLIGEAPGADEDRQGLPFVGRAGQLLDRMLAAIGLDRQKVYITNIVNWRPPGNREPSPEEAAICLPFLHRHIELANPKLLVLLGAVPVRHITGLPGILRHRGRWESYRCRTSGREVPVMLTLHPAYLLRQPAAKRLAWQDLTAISQRAKSLGLA